eukprot:TRINITY_DN193_c0_g2_i1.p1 TRINITY_DN193_c0_g2~~TRINITY_DN193_c0_g2_i1.p1  ORF type:complete len:2694 (+),score=670.20 TRINITY_DN193_c0_g2_i1:95-8176(+)
MAWAGGAVGSQAALLAQTRAHLLEDDESNARRRIGVRRAAALSTLLQYRLEHGADAQRRAAERAERAARQALRRAAPFRVPDPDAEQAARVVQRTFRVAAMRGEARAMLRAGLAEADAQHALPPPPPLPDCSVLSQQPVIQALDALDITPTVSSSSLPVARVTSGIHPRLTSPGSGGLSALPKTAPGGMQRRGSRMRPRLGDKPGTSPPGSRRRSYVPPRPAPRSAHSASSEALGGTQPPAPLLVLAELAAEMPAAEQYAALLGGAFSEAGPECAALAALLEICAGAAPGEAFRELVAVAGEMPRPAPLPRPPLTPMLPHAAVPRPGSPSLTASSFSTGTLAELRALAAELGDTARLSSLDELIRIAEERLATPSSDIPVVQSPDLLDGTAALAVTPAAGAADDLDDLIALLNIVQGTVPAAEGIDMLREALSTPYRSRLEPAPALPPSAGSRRSAADSVPAAAAARAALPPPVSAAPTALPRRHFTALHTVLEAGSLGRGGLLPRGLGRLGDAAYPALRQLGTLGPSAVLLLPAAQAPALSLQQLGRGARGSAPSSPRSARYTPRSARFRWRYLALLASEAPESAAISAVCIAATRSAPGSAVARLLSVGGAFPGVALSVLAEAAGKGTRHAPCPYTAALLSTQPRLGSVEATAVARLLPAADALRARPLPMLAAVARTREAWRRPMLAAVADAARVVPAQDRFGRVRLLENAIAAARDATLRSPGVPHLRALLEAAARPLHRPKALLGALRSSSPRAPPPLVRSLAAAGGVPPALAARQQPGGRLTALLEAAGRASVGGAAPPPRAHLRQLAEARGLPKWKCIRLLLNAWGAAAPAARVAMWPSQSWAHRQPNLRLLAECVGEARRRRPHCFVRLLAETRPRALGPGMRVETPEGSGKIEARVHQGTPQWGRWPRCYGGWVVMLDSGALTYCSVQDARPAAAPRHVRLLALSATLRKGDAGPRHVELPRTLDLLEEMGERIDAATWLAVVSPPRGSRPGTASLLSALGTAAAGQQPLLQQIVPRPAPAAAAASPAGGARLRPVRVQLQKHSRLGIGIRLCGTTVTHVEPGSYAALRGIAVGNTILKVQGVAVSTQAEAAAALARAPCVLAVDVGVPRNWQPPVLRLRQLQQVAGREPPRHADLLFTTARLVPLDRYRRIRRLLKAAGGRGLAALANATHSSASRFSSIAKCYVAGRRVLLRLLARAADHGDVNPQGIMPAPTRLPKPPGGWRQQPPRRPPARPLGALSAMLPPGSALGHMAGLPVREAGYGVSILCAGAGAALLSGQSKLLRLLRSVRGPPVFPKQPGQGLAALQALTRWHQTGVAALVALRKSAPGEPTPQRAATAPHPPDSAPGALAAGEVELPGSEGVITVRDWVPGSPAHRDHSPAPFVRMLARSAVPPRAVSVLAAVPPPDRPLLRDLCDAAPRSLLRGMVAPTYTVGQRLRVRDLGRQWLWGTVTGLTDSGAPLVEADGFGRAWEWDEVDTAASQPPFIEALWQAAHLDEGVCGLVAMLPRLGDPASHAVSVLQAACAVPPWAALLFAEAGVDLSKLEPVDMSSPAQRPAGAALAAMMQSATAARVSGPALAALTTAGGGRPVTPPPVPGDPQGPWRQLLSAIVRRSVPWDLPYVGLILEDKREAPPLGSGLMVLADCFDRPARGCPALVRVLSRMDPEAAEAMRGKRGRRGMSPKRVVVEPPRPWKETHRLSERLWVKYWAAHEETAVTESYARRALGRGLRLTGQAAWGRFTVERCAALTATETATREALQGEMLGAALAMLEGSARGGLVGAHLEERAAGALPHAPVVWQAEEVVGRSAAGGLEAAARQELTDEAAMSHMRITAVLRIRAAGAIQRMVRQAFGRKRRAAAYWRREATEAWEIRRFRDAERELRREVRLRYEERELAWMGLAEDRSMEFAVLFAAPVAPGLVEPEKHRRREVQHIHASELAGLGHRFRLGCVKLIPTLFAHTVRTEHHRRARIVADEDATLEREVLSKERAGFLGMVGRERARRNVIDCEAAEPAVRAEVAASEQDAREQFPALPTYDPVSELDPSVAGPMEKIMNRWRGETADEEFVTRTTIMTLRHSGTTALRAKNRCEVDAMHALVEVEEQEHQEHVQLWREYCSRKIDIECSEPRELVALRRRLEAERRPMGGEMVTKVFGLVDEESAAREVVADANEGERAVLRAHCGAPGALRHFMPGVFGAPFTTREARQREGVRDAEGVARTIIRALEQAAPARRRQRRAERAEAEVARAAEEASAADSARHFAAAVMPTRRQELQRAEQSLRATYERAERKEMRALLTTELRARPAPARSAIILHTGAAAELPAVGRGSAARRHSASIAAAGPGSPASPPQAPAPDTDPPPPSAAAGGGAHAARALPPVAAYMRRFGAEPSPAMQRAMGPTAMARYDAAARGHALLRLSRTVPAAAPPDAGAEGPLSSTVPRPGEHPPPPRAPSPAWRPAVAPTGCVPDASVDSPLLRTLLRVPLSLEEQRARNLRSPQYQRPNATLRDLRRSQTETATFDAEGLGWGDEQLQPYLAALGKNRSISVLRLGGNVVSDSSAASIAALIAQPSSRLALLHLSNCGLSAEGAARIAAAARDNERVVRCDLSGNPLADPQMLVALDAQLAGRAARKAAAIERRRVQGSAGRAPRRQHSASGSSSRGKSPAPTPPAPAPAAVLPPADQL